MAAAISRKSSSFLTGVLVAILFAIAAWRLYVALRTPLAFDDAYMFYRYARNMRHGLGMSWNLDGVHTYGETALLWGFVVLGLSFLPVTAAHALVIGSWICAVGAPVAVARAVARNAKSRFMGSTWRVIPLVAIPLVSSPGYGANAVTGMETMLAAMLAVIFLGIAIAWEDGDGQPYSMAFVGLAMFLTRPEMALAVYLVPLLMMMFGRGTRRGFILFAGLFTVGALVALIACKLYFGTPFPLSFYMKSGQAYEGYHASWNPLTHAITLLLSCSPFLLALALLTRKSEWRMVISIVLPALATFAYLCTVTQIMGTHARYYVPYVAFFAVPALLVLDRRLASGEVSWTSRWLAVRALGVGGAIFAVVCLVLVLHVSRMKVLLDSADLALERRPYVYDQVRLDVAASRPLPYKNWLVTIEELGNVLLAPLPKGTTIAASEVGYLGVADPSGNVIDSEGLNDNQIALHGFNMDELLRRAPDIIWLPHPDYTFQRGSMMTDPALLDQYDVYAGAADYGLALRKNSPVRAQIDKQMALVWRDFYPGYRMEDYRVRSASWTHRKYKATEIQDAQTVLNNSIVSGQNTGSHE